MSKKKNNLYVLPVTISSILSTMPPALAADQVIIEIDKLLNKWGTTKKLDSNFNYAERLAPSTDDRCAFSQCRQDGWNEEELAEMQSLWEKGVPMRQYPIGVEIDGMLFTAVGNHRAESMRRAGLTGKYIIVGEGLALESDKLLLLQKLANVSNSKHSNDKRTDATKDIISQVKGAWASVKNVDVNSQNPIGAPERHWNSLYNSASTIEAADIIQRDWFEGWMNENKPCSFTHQSTRTKIFNTSLTDKTGQGGLLPLTLEEKKKAFQKSFAGYTWDENKYKFENGEEIWQIPTTWNKRTANSTLNLSRTILYTCHRLSSKFVLSNKHEIHVIVDGDSCATSLAGRDRHISEWLAEITKFNQNPNNKKWDLPSVTKVLFTKSLNGCGDSDFAYEMNTMTREFYPIGLSLIDEQLSFGSSTSPSREEIVTVTEKKCSTCHEVKEADEFYTCRPPNSKDGLQPRCKPCCKEYEARAASKRRVAAIANGNNPSSSQWDGTIFIGGNK